MKIFSKDNLKKVIILVIGTLLGFFVFGAIALSVKKLKTPLRGFNY